MTKLKSKLVMLLAAIFVTGVFATGCNLIEKNPEAIAKQKVAKVGNEYITRAELDEMFNPTVEQLKADPQYGANYLTSDEGKKLLETQKKSLLDSMVEQKLFEQKAKELNLFKDDNEINEEVKKSRDSLVKSYPSEEEFNKKLEESKISKDLLNKLLKGQVVSQKVFDNIVKDIAVPDDEIQKFYDENKVSMTEKPNTMEVSHILLKTEEEAKAVKAELDKGGNFEAIAKEKSIEPAAKESGGKLGEIMYNDPNYDPTFVTAAMGLKEGQISDPVATQFGFHIIKVTKKTEYPILALDKVKDEIKEQLLGQKKEQKYYDALKEWKDKAGIKTYDENINNIK